MTNTTHNLYVLHEDADRPTTCPYTDANRAVTMGRNLAKMFVEPNNSLRNQVSVLWVVDSDNRVIWSRRVDYKTSRLHRDLSYRAEFAENVAEATDDRGRIWFGESGMDCDCSQYTHGPSFLEVEGSGIFATQRAWEREWDRRNEWADGSFSLYFIPREHHDEFRCESRDLAMEAFEDGHPHVVSSVPFDEQGSYARKIDDERREADRAGLRITNL